MVNETKRLALITGASNGLGFALAKSCREVGYDLLIAADGPEIYRAQRELASSPGGSVRAIEANLATAAGVNELLNAAEGRPISALITNASVEIQQEFLDQDFSDVQRVIDANVTGTLFLIQKVGREMRRRKSGRILLTGSLAGQLQRTQRAVYEGTRGLLANFAFALQAELQRSGVTVTCLIPDEVDVPVSGTRMPETEQKAIDTARRGVEAMLRGEAEVASTSRSGVMRSPVSGVNLSDGVAPPSELVRGAVTRRSA